MKHPSDPENWSPVGNELELDHQQAVRKVNTLYA